MSEIRARVISQEKGLYTICYKTFRDVAFVTTMCTLSHDKVHMVVTNATSLNVTLKTARNQELPDHSNSNKLPPLRLNQKQQRQRLDYIHPRSNLQ